MKKYLITKVMKLIKAKFNYDKSKLEEIMYGLETFYITITKTIVIVGISYLIDTNKELFLIMLFYGILRFFGFGMHAKKSWHCWTLSLTIFVLLPYLVKVIYLNIIIRFVIYIFCIAHIIIHAPADTEKRPLINKRKRSLFKILATISSLIFSAYSLITKNISIQNAITFSLILECLMISPFTYKIFKLKYANYKNYLL